MAEDTDHDAARAAALAALQGRVRTHTDCGFEICEQATNLVPGDGNPHAEVMLVGEAPGASEDAAGRPFVGRAGRLLDSLLAAAGFARGDVYVSNVVKARPPGNRDPRADEIAHWLPVLREELSLVEPALVVPLGRHALAHFAPGAKITQVAGTLLEGAGPDDRALYPLLHPAAALRSKDMRARLEADAAGLPDALRRIRGEG